MLLDPINDSIANINAIKTSLETWGVGIQTAHDNLAKGSATIQGAEIDLGADIAAMNNAIDGLNKQISAENKAIAASAGAIGIGIFALVVGIALAPETGGTSLIAGGAIGAAGIIGGGVTWGIMQNRINSQFKEISKDQNEIASDKRQIVALQALSSGTDNACSNLVLASTSLSTLRTQWAVFKDLLANVLKDLDKAENSVSVTLQGVFTAAAQEEWKSASATALALVNRPSVQVECRTLPMNGIQVA